MQQIQYTKCLTLFELEPTDYPQVDTNMPKGALLEQLIEKAKKVTNSLKLSHPLLENERDMRNPDFLGDMPATSKPEVF